MFNNEYLLNKNLYMGIITLSNIIVVKISINLLLRNKLISKINLLKTMFQDYLTLGKLILNIRMHRERKSTLMKIRFFLCGENCSLPLFAYLHLFLYQK